MITSKLKNGIIIKIRKLENNDFKNGFLETLRILNPVPLKPDNSKKYFEEIQRNNPNTHIYVALTDENNIIGTATLTVDQKFGGRVGRLEDVATMRGYEGLGISSALQKVIISKANELKCYKLILNCKENLIDFYTKFGFKKDQISMKIEFEKNKFINLINLAK